MKRLWMLASIVGSMAAGSPTSAAAEAQTASSAAAADRCAPADGMIFVCGIHHPEDIDALPGGRWVIASQTSFGHGVFGSGALVLIDTRTLATRRVPGVAPSARARPPYSACPSPPALFSPHGLALRPGTGGHALLYVVNHGREAVEMFDVRVGSGTPELRWIGCVMVPRPVYLNAVAPTPDGGFVVTKTGDADAEPMWTRMRSEQNTGSIYRWRPGRGAPVEIAGSEGSANNGIAVDRDGRIFLSSWGMRSVARFTPQGDGYKRDEISVGFYTDNMRWAPDGGLLVTGQRHDGFKGPPGCSPPACAIKWAVVRIDPTSLVSTPLLDNDGRSFSGATTALPVGRDLWLGSFVDEKVAVIRNGYTAR